MSETSTAPNYASSPTENITMWTRINPLLRQMIDDGIKTIGCKDRSEFIRDALKFYLKCYVNSNVTITIEEK